MNLWAVCNGVWRREYFVLKILLEQVTVDDLDTQSMTACDVQTAEQQGYYSLGNSGQHEIKACLRSVACWPMSLVLRLPNGHQATGVL